jgi:monofunctional glycosyltransferase
MWTVVTVIALVVLGAAFLTVLYLALPDVDHLRAEQPGPTRYMKLRAMELSVPVESFAWEWIDLEEVAPRLVCAVLLAEDDGFFRHHGIAWSQVRTAASRWWNDLPTGGASTITQQLARNLFLGPERTMVRKLREALMARKLERSLPKRRILELYLNVIELGERVWGVEAASQHHLGRTAREVELFEAVFLAGLIAAPRRALVGPNQERAHQVQRRVLRTMYRVHLIDEREWAQNERRIELVHVSLDGGASLRESIERAREAELGVLPYPARRLGFPVILWEVAVAAECGHERILAYDDAR